VKPPLRFTLAVVALALSFVATTAATASSAGSEDEALATARTFVDALVHRDGARACALFSSNAVAELGGQARCVNSLSAADEGGQSELDLAAFDMLERGYLAAKLSATKRKGQFVTKKFGARKLARDMEELDSDLTVKLGKSAAAAKGQLSTTVILDTRSTGRRLVLYAESDSGAIFRLSSTAGGHPDIEPAGTGIPEASAPGSNDQGDSSSETGTVDSVTIDSAGTAFARGKLVVTEDDETYRYGILLVLIQENGSYHVDDIFYSSLTSGEDDGA